MNPRSPRAPRLPSRRSARRLPARPIPAPGPSTTERPTTRDELWVPIVLLVLTFLCIEWALYHRDGLIRIKRSLTTRLRRDAGGTA